MENLSEEEHAIELLQELGLKEYEAKSFVALSRLPRGTAKDISTVSDVPRTRVYDATRVLEAKGLIEIQHTNPQQFRAVPIEEAVETLRLEYESRTESLREALLHIEPAQIRGCEDATHEVWALSRTDAIEYRIIRLIEEAERELSVVVTRPDHLSDRLSRTIEEATARDVAISIGVASPDELEELRKQFPCAEVFVSALEWNSVMAEEDVTTEVTRLVLVDGRSILVSTASSTTDEASVTEQAVCAKGLDNGVVAIARRFMTAGLIGAGEADPAAN